MIVEDRLIQLIIKFVFSKILISKAPMSETEQ